MRSFLNRPLTVLAILVLNTSVAASVSGQVSEIDLVDDQLEKDLDDWPWWRGPHRNGVAVEHDDLPLEWNADRNIKWKTAVPGRGHSAPIIVGDQIFLTTCNETVGSQSLLSFNRGTGEQLWETVIHPSGAMQKNLKSSAASGSAACDGERVFVAFACNDAAYVSATSLDGELLWQKELCDYVVHQGYGASPAIYRSTVIVSADNKAGGRLAALDVETGEFVWKRERPEKPNYSSPIIVHSAGRDQLIMTGCDQVVSYDPATGETLWEIAGATTECVTSTVTDGQLVYSSGGYPRNHISAVRADGSNEVVWESKDRVYVPSLVLRDGHLYGVLDAGIAACWNCETGELKWKARLSGTFSASPVLVGERIYATNEEGETYVFLADPDAFEQVAMNRLGEQTLATPTIARGEIFIRTAIWRDDLRQEYLYCISPE